MIDVHAHHWPSALLRAFASGNTWFGWEPVTLRDGSSALALGDRLVRFRPPQIDLDDLPARVRLRELEHLVRAEVLMPVGFLWGDHLGPADAAAMCREMNEELAEVQRTSPRRFRGVGMLPFHAPNQFEAELEMAVAAGIRAFAVPTNVQGRNLDEPSVSAMLETLVAADVAMIVHPTYLTSIGADRLTRYYFGNTFGAPMESALALMSLIHGGFRDRNPEARVLILNGGGCAPYEIGRFARRYETRVDTRTMARPPRDYVATFSFDSLVLDEASLRLLVDRVGTKRVMLGTDHPFTTDVLGGSVRWLAGMDWLTELGGTEDILHLNAAGFFGEGLGDTPPVDAESVVREQ